MLRIASDRRRLFPARCQEREPVRSPAFALLCAVALAGCGPGPAQFAAPVVIRTAAPPKPSMREPSMRELAVREPIPLPEPALLVPPSEPPCEFTGSDPADAARVRLDYERQCYRHAEIIVRDRLRALQVALEETVSAVRRSERAP